MNTIETLLKHNTKEYYIKKHPVIANMYGLCDNVLEKFSLIRGIIGKNDYTKYIKEYVVANNLSNNAIDTMEKHGFSCLNISKQDDEFNRLMMDKFAVKIHYDNLFEESYKKNEVLFRLSKKPLSECNWIGNTIMENIDELKIYFPWDRNMQLGLRNRTLKKDGLITYKDVIEFKVGS